MGEIVNLNRFKKRIEREQSASQAGVNRARFGRTKAERAIDDKSNDRASKSLDQHKLDDGDAS